MALFCPSFFYRFFLRVSGMIVEVVMMNQIHDHDEMATEVQRLALSPCTFKSKLQYHHCHDPTRAEMR